MTDKDYLIGKTLGKYRLVEYLGAGAMARVYKAYHASLDRYVAVKVLHAYFASDENFIEQFTREARSLATLRHPNVLQVYDLDTDAGMPYIVMEYIEGNTLGDLVAKYRKKHVRIPLAQGVRVVNSIGAALSYAHKRGIIHRDVKPSNVLHEKTGRVVLGDFGLARLLNGKRHSQTGTVTGTPAYMSPEQGLGKSRGVTSDIYSLGVILFELAIGQLPFEDDNPYALVMKHVKEPLPEPKSLYPELPDPIEKVIVKSLRKNPAERYQSVDAFLDDLGKYDADVKTATLPMVRLARDIESNQDQRENFAIPPMPPTTEDAEVSLYFGDTGQILTLERGNEYVIGRKSRKQPVVPDIDLTPFKAYEWGISRIHSNLEIGPQAVTITDLGSSNGTWLGSTRLEPHSPQPLKHGDVIFLGKLKVQVLIYE